MSSHRRGIAVGSGAFVRGNGRTFYQPTDLATDVASAVATLPEKPDERLSTPTIPRLLAVVTFSAATLLTTATVVDRAQSDTDTPAGGLPLPDLATAGTAPAAPAAGTMPLAENALAVTASAAHDSSVAAADKVVTTKVATMASVTTSATAPASVRKEALENALGKLGKPYRWGATGPNAFDCSGLVKWSFESAGKKLPRTSREQARVGTPVSKDDLQPGDLVFFYQPISHVGIYVGDGKVVHASRTGQPVKITSIQYMRFNTARRV